MQSISQGDMAARISKIQACTQNRVLNFSVVFNGTFRVDVGVLEWTGDGSEIKLSLRIDQLKDATVYWADSAALYWTGDFIDFVYSLCVDTVPTVIVDADGRTGVVLKYDGGSKKFTFHFHSRDTDRLVATAPPVRSAYRLSSVDTLVASVSALLEELRR